MNSKEQAKQLLSNRMLELGYSFSSYYEKETLNLMIEFARIKCEEQKQECSYTEWIESKSEIESILNCRNVCND